MPKKTTPKKKTIRRSIKVKSATPIPMSVSAASPIIHEDIPAHPMSDTLPADHSVAEPQMEIKQPPVPPATPLIRPAKKTQRVWLRVASICLIIIGLAAIIYPFWPEIQYRFWPPDENDALGALTITDASQAVAGTFTTGSLPINHATVGGDNRIIIDKIGVDMKIVEGTTEAALNLGAWHLGYTSTPDKGGNTVITAHRYKYRPPSKKTFYLLDKLELGDAFQVIWEGLQYKYQVTDIKVVEPNDIYVLNPTSNPEVTLITCTPLFTTKQRLVVVGQEIP